MHEELLKKIMDIYDACEDAKVASFEACIRAEDLTEWNATADRLELAAYQKIKMLIREGLHDGMPAVRWKNKDDGQPALRRDTIPEAKVS